MSTELAAPVVAMALALGAIFLVPIARARIELERLRRRYDLNDEELAAYVRELPEVCHAVADSLGAERSPREVERIASESTIVAILRARRRHRADRDRERATGGPGDPGEPAAARPAGLTREALRRSLLRR